MSRFAHMPLPGFYRQSRGAETPHGELLFSLFGALAQYERALTRERMMAGLAAARRRGRRGGRPPTIDAERLEQITAALTGCASKSSISRTFNVPRSTLADTLARTRRLAPKADV